MPSLIKVCYPLVLLLAFAVFFIAGIDKPALIDSCEGSSAAVARHMYLDREIVVPTLDGAFSPDRPPLLYWLKMLGYHLFGINTLGARIFAAICGLATLLALYRTARKPLGSRPAFHAALILGGSLLFVNMARIGSVDMALTCLWTVTLLFFWSSFEQVIRGRSGTMLFLSGCICSGLAALGIGGLGILMPLLALVLYTLSIRRPGLLYSRSLLPGILAALVTGYCWYALLWLVSAGTASQIGTLPGAHLLTVFRSPPASPAWPGYASLIILLAGFFPWSFYLPHAVMVTPCADRNQPAARLVRLFSLFTGMSLLLSLCAGSSPTVLVLPALPGLSLLLALLFNSDDDAYTFGWRLPGILAAASIALAGLACAILVPLFPYLYELHGGLASTFPILTESADLGFTPWFAATLLAASAVIVWHGAGKRSRRSVFEALLLCSLVLSCTVAHLLVPLYCRLAEAPLARLANQAEQLSANGRIILYRVVNKGSITVASGQPTMTVATDDYPGLLNAFRATPRMTVGITTAYAAHHLQQIGIPVVTLARDSGFVLFRIPVSRAETQPESSPPSHPES